MEKKNAFLGKDIDGGLLYLNNGKYGYFITNNVFTTMTPIVTNYTLIHF